MNRARRALPRLSVSLGAASILALSLLMPLVGSPRAMPAWIPGPNDIATVAPGWTIPVGGNLTTVIEHVIVNPANASANDTAMHSQLWIHESTNKTVVVNFIDFEAGTGTVMQGSVFDIGIPQETRGAVNSLLAAYTTVQFTGSTTWDLIAHVFTHAWDAMVPGTKIDVSITTLDGHATVLLDYKGHGDTGLVSFTRLGNKACLAFSFNSEAAWKNASTFNGTVHQFVVAFLTPLKEIMHAAAVSQFPLLSSASGHLAPDVSPLPSSSGTYLTETEFLGFMGAIISTIEVPFFWPVLNLPQLVSIILASIFGAIAVVMIVHYGRQARAAEKGKVLDSKKKEELGEHVDLR